MSDPAAHPLQTRRSISAAQGLLKNLGLAGGFLLVAADAKMQSPGSAFSLNLR